MKTKTLLAIIVAALLAGCAADPISTYKPENTSIKVEFLFENDGVKVYRFEDGGKYIYYTDARGRTQYSTGGKNPVHVQVETAQ